MFLGHSVSGDSSIFNPIWAWGEGAIKAERGCRLVFLGVCMGQLLEEGILHLLIGVLVAHPLGVKRKSLIFFFWHKSLIFFFWRKSRVERKN